MASTHLAFDIGAESGRALIGRLDNNRLSVRELSRFPNGMLTLRGRLHWNLFRLFEQIKQSLMRYADEKDEVPASLGIDTWGVDFGLLARDGSILGLPYAYRDRGTEGAMASFFKKVPQEKIYELTGIQFLPFNTLYQLHAMVRDASPLLDAATDLLFIPDLFHYLLTGEKKTEFTFATTSQLFNPRSNDWEGELISALGIPRSWFQPVVMPGTELGNLADSVAQETGFPSVSVVAVATHDTGSAVAAVPAQGDDWAFISSGTWSLMGIESDHPILSEQALRFNFTNEGGVGNTFRVLKNIAGLWPLQQCRQAWSSSGPVSYDELVEQARTAPALASLVDPDHPDFLNPSDMPEAIGQRCRLTGQPVPESRGAMVRCILESLALKYRAVLEQLHRISDRPICRVHMIGGGCHNRLLCQFAANAMNLPVIAGPVEATAIGNLLVQAMALGRLASTTHLRSVVRDSFPVEHFAPSQSEPWEAAWQRFGELNPI